MRPEERRNKDQYRPRWRHFHPQATLYMRNPFEEDVIFQVADEHNQPWEYRLRAGKISELPGGLIATLGLKTVVDRMIGESKTDAVRIWEPSVREQYEKQVIVRVKEAPQPTNADGPSGPVDLTASGEDDDDRTAAAPQKHAEEKAFPDLRRKAPQQQQDQPPAPQNNGRRNTQRQRDEGVAAIASASLGAQDKVIEED